MSEVFSERLHSLLSGIKEQEQIKHALITGGEVAGLQIAEKIINAGQIGVVNVTAQIKAAEVSRAVQEAQEAIAADASQRALQEYFNALRSFNRSPYRALSSFFGSRQLSDIYIPLRAAGINLQEKHVELTTVMARLEKSSRPLLIEGKPGGGKSTLLRHLALNAWYNPEDVGLSSPHLPLLIRLQCVGETEGTLGQRLWRAVERARDLHLSADQPPSNYFSDWPRRMNSTWLLLLDGWDEIPERQRAEVADWLRALCANDSNTPYRLVLTTRPTQSIPGDLLQEFDRYWLESLNEGQRKELARRWLGDEADTFLKWASRMQSGSLAGTPLLLTLSAIVYKSRAENSLPARRVDLYAQFLDTWFEEALLRGADVQIDGRVAPHLGTVLERVALAMTGGEDINLSTVDELTPVVAQTLAPLLNQTVESLSAEGIAGSPGTARSLLRVLGERSGLFLCFGQTCTWLHPTFREYLTARAIARQPSDGGFAPDAPAAFDLLSKWDTDRWRQVILMLLALWSDTPNAVDNLIAHLADLAPPRSAIYAAQAITEGARVGEETDLRIVDWLCDICRAGASDDYCAQLLTPIDQLLSKQAQRLLKPRIHEPRLQPSLTLLAQDYAQFARSLQNVKSSQKIRTTAVFQDMREMEMWEALLELAEDTTLRPVIRATALNDLPLPYAGRALPLLLGLLDAQESDGYDGLTPMVLSTIARLGDRATLFNVAADWINLPSFVRWRLPQAANDEELLRDWRGDRSKPLDLRISASCRLLNLALERYQSLNYSSSEEGKAEGQRKAQEEITAIVESLFSLLRGDEDTDGRVPGTASSSDPQINPAEFCHDDAYKLLVDTLVNAGRIEDLGRAVRLNGGGGEHIRDKAIQKLSEAGALEEMLALVKDPGLNSSVRERVACVLSENPQLGNEAHAAVAEQLLAFLNKRLRVRQGNHALLQARAQVFISQNELEAAEPDLSAIIDDLERLRWALTTRGASYRIRRWNYSAVQDLSRALRIEPEHRFSLINRAVAHHESGNYADALSDFELLGDYRFEFSWAVWRHGDSLRELGRVDEARALLDEYLKVWDDSPEAWAVRGRCDVDTRPPDQLGHAVACFQRAITVEPQYPWAYRQRGGCYRMRDQLNEALRDFDHLCRLDPDSAYAVRVRAQLCIRLGALDQARADIERLRAMKTAEDSTLFLEALCEQAAGNGTSFREKVAQAEQSLRATLVEENSCDAATRVSLLQLLLAAGDADSAAKQLGVLLTDEKAKGLLRDELLPDLNDLCVILLDRREVRAFRDSLRDQLYPPSAPKAAAADADEPPPSPKTPLEPHPPYPCPMYCRRASIQGLMAEKRRADQILSKHSDGRTMVLLTIEDGGDRLYGQWNFKQRPEDEYEMKFSDELNTVLRDNLRTIVQGFRVQTILFLEEKLSDTFREEAAQQGLAVRCLLVDESL